MKNPHRLGYLLLLFPLFFGVWAGARDRSADESANLRSTFIKSDFYDRSYEAAKPIEQKPDEVKGLLVNHHLLASHLIAQAFEQVASEKNRTVVLLAPNHFERGGQRIITSAQAWATPYGKLYTNQNIIRQLNNSGLVSINDTPFMNEHGVSGLVAFVKKSLPNARIVPIIFKVATTPTQAQQLSSYLLKILPPDALIVASLDMSHYVADSVADINDSRTVTALEKLDISEVNKLEVDSRAAFSVLVEAMKLEGAWFNLLARSSSAKLIGSKNPLDNTSYITGYFRL